MNFLAPAEFEEVVYVFERAPWMEPIPYIVGAIGFVLVGWLFFRTGKKPK